MDYHYRMSIRIPRIIRIGSTSVYTLDDEIEQYRDIAVINEMILNNWIDCIRRRWRFINMEML